MPDVEIENLSPNRIIDFLGVHTYLTYCQIVFPYLQNYITNAAVRALRRNSH